MIKNTSFQQAPRGAREFLVHRSRSQLRPQVPRPSNNDGRNPVESQSEEISILGNPGQDSYPSAMSSPRDLPVRRFPDFSRNKSVHMISVNEIEHAVISKWSEPNPASPGYSGPRQLSRPTGPRLVFEESIIAGLRRDHFIKFQGQNFAVSWTWCGDDSGTTICFPCLWNTRPCRIGSPFSCYVYQGHKFQRSRTTL